MYYETKRESELTKFFKSDRGDALGWGLVFFWGAIVVLMEATLSVENISWWDGWALFFIGFGTIALIGGVIAVKVELYSKAGWNFLFGFIILGFGVDGLLETGWIWVLVLLGIGTVLIYAAVSNNWTIDDADWDWCMPSRENKNE